MEALNYPHFVSKNELLKKLKVDLTSGLSLKEVQERLKLWGKNEISPQQVHPLVRNLLDQILNPLVLILVFAGLISLILGELLDALAIFLAGSFSLGMGVWQSYKAENVLRKLASALDKKVLVLRDRRFESVSFKDLVPGDIVILKAGEKVPADIRILEGSNLIVREAPLTGEFLPVKKEALDFLPKETPLAERKNMLFMGTFIEEGEAKGIVVATGMNTELGKIATLVKKIKLDKTPLQKRIEVLAKFLTLIIGILVGVIFLLGILQNRSLEEVLLLSLAVAVASVPEGLVPALTLILAIASLRILQKKGLIKRFSSAETLGSVSVICVDKTGTLTKGEMSLVKVVNLKGSFDFKDLQLEENFGFTKGLREALYFANEAKITYQGNKEVIIGDPTDQALLKAALDLGIKVKEAEELNKKIAFLPFSSKRRFLASFNQKAIFLAGALEAILDKLKLSDSEKVEVLKQEARLAQEGKRVIALAKKEVTLEEKEYSHEELLAKLKDLEFLALLALEDPIREEVKEALKEVRKAGIKVIMITGDHKLTAERVGKELGFKTGRDYVLEGKDIDSLSTKELSTALERVEIIARATPENKIKIVDVLQDKKEIVAMTGDGINDAPALKSADIGIALADGTDIAKSSADLILLENGFKVIVEAVKQGRIVLDNIKKSLAFLLIDSFTEVWLIMFALFLNLPLPMTGIQILWLNFIEDTLPGAALGFEKGEKGIMNRKPLKEISKLVDSLIKKIVLYMGLVAALIALASFWIVNQILGYPLEVARTVVLTLLASNSLFIIFALKSLKEPIAHISFWGNKFLNFTVILSFTLLLLAVYFKPLNLLLGTAPLPLLLWIFPLLSSIFQLAIVEIIKDEVRGNARG